MDETPLQTAQPEQGCINCGSAAVLHDYPTPLCSECREKLIRFPIPKWMWAFAGAIVVALLYAVITFPKTIRIGVAYERGTNAEEEHRYVTAQHEFEKVVASVPDYLEGQGHLMIAASHNVDAVAFEKAYHALENKNIANSYLLGQLNHAVNKMESYAPADSLRELFASYASSQNGMPESTLLKLLYTTGNDIYVQNAYASTLYNREEYHMCDSVIHHVLAKEPDNLISLHLIISSKRRAEKLDSALFYCEKALSQNKEDVFAIASIARTYLQMKKDREALNVAHRAYALANQDGFTLATLALAYHFNNDTKSRDQVIQKYAGDSSTGYFMKYVVDVVNNKEKFRN